MSQCAKPSTTETNDKWRGDMQSVTHWLNLLTLPSGAGPWRTQSALWAPHHGTWMPSTLSHAAAFDVHFPAAFHRVHTCAHAIGWGAFLLTVHGKEESYVLYFLRANSTVCYTDCETNLRMWCIPKVGSLVSVRGRLAYFLGFGGLGCWRSFCLSSLLTLISLFIFNLYFTQWAQNLRTVNNK